MMTIVCYGYLYKCSSEKTTYGEKNTSKMVKKYIFKLRSTRFNLSHLEHGA